MGNNRSLTMERSRASLRLLPFLLLLVAGSAALPSKKSLQAPLVLTAFDGSGKSFNWIEENDPVMGGKSTNCTFQKIDQRGVFAGTVEIVPALKAPGFCFARTLLTFSSDFPDASNYDSLEIQFLSSIAYTGFKAAFLADT